MVSSIFKMADTINPFIVPALHLSEKGSFSTVPDLADKVISSFMLILVISVILLVLVTSVMIYFVIRYRKKKSPSAIEVREPLLLEISWTVIPTILVLIMFYVGWENFVPLRQVPDNAMPVKVTGRMWSWQFEYENGIKSNVLRAPLGVPVKLTLTSDDVIHSLFIPDFKIKEDAVPGLETNLWFFSRDAKEHVIFCAEYCGHGHSSMNSKVIVMHEKEFNTWYSGKVKKEGEAISLQMVPELLDENGCLECHSLDGSALVGPTFTGLFGRKRNVMTNGKEREITAHKEYIRKSILYPDADIVKGYPEVMPSYEGELSEKEITAITEYLKGLK
jgi:cytochrome c oxidase subunit 2